MSTEAGSVGVLLLRAVALTGALAIALTEQMTARSPSREVWFICLAVAIGPEGLRFLRGHSDR